MAKKIIIADKEDLTEAFKKAKRDVEFERGMAKAGDDLSNALPNAIKRTSPLEILLTAGVLGVLFVAFLTIAAVAVVFMTMIYGWQLSISQLSDMYAVSGISFAFIISIVGLVLIVGFWAFSVFRIVKTQKKTAWLFAIVCIVCYAVTHFLSILMLNAGDLSDCLSGGILLAILPTFILIDIRYYLTKGYGLIRKMAYKLCKGKGLRRAIFIILGILTFILSLVALSQFKNLGEAQMAVMFGGSLLPTGLLFIYMSIFGKTEPVGKDFDAE